MAHLQQPAQVGTQEKKKKVDWVLPVGKYDYYPLSPECQASAPQERQKGAKYKR